MEKLLFWRNLGTKVSRIFY